MIYFVAFLRGINVGGNKIIPMKELAALFEQIGFKNIKTILNSGNVVFEFKETSEAVLVKKIEKAIEDNYGFEVTVQIRKLDDIKKMIKKNPFKDFKPDKNFHWYVTFLNDFKSKLPSVTSDIYKLLGIENDALFCIMDRTKGLSTDFMNFLDKTFGKKVTTRNWNTLVRIAKL
jgi:uncharacterized protein (DUF1697 family)